MQPAAATPAAAAATAAKSKYASMTKEQLLAELEGRDKSGAQDAPVVAEDDALSAKQRAQRDVEEADFALASDLFSGVTSVDKLEPASVADFATLAGAIAAKAAKYASKPEFPAFVENVVLEIAQRTF